DCIAPAVLAQDAEVFEVRVYGAAKVGVDLAGHLAVGDGERPTAINVGLQSDGPSTHGALEQAITKPRHVPHEVAARLVAIVDACVAVAEIQIAGVHHRPERETVAPRVRELRHKPVAIGMADLYRKAVVIGDAMQHHLRYQAETRIGLGEW